MTATSSANHAFHVPLEIGTATAQAVEDQISSLDAAETAGRLLTSNEVVRATLAETTLQTNIAAEAVARAAADTSEAAARFVADATEAAARIAAVATEAAARAAAVGAEIVDRANAVTGLQSQIDVLDAVASTSGGTASTTLSRLAAAFVITSIAGNGTLTTVTTSTNHGLTANDELRVAGTTNYNSDTGPISILSANQFTYLSGVNAATETTGTAASLKLYVASITGFVPNQRISVTNDQGDLHVTRVNGTPSGGAILLFDAVPTSWTGSSKASVGAWVSTTLEEVALARGSMPGSGLNLATLLRYGLGYRCAPDAFAGANDAAKIAAAFTAADSGNGELLLTRDYVLDTTDQLVLSGSKVKIAAQRGGRIVVASTSTALRPFVLRNATDIDIDDLTLLCNRTGPTAGICIENSSRVRVQGARIQSYPVYGICISQNSAPLISSSAITFTASTKTLAGAVGLFSGLTAGDVFVLQQSSYNNGMHTVATKAGDGSSITVLETVTDEVAGQPVTIQIATACDDITIEGCLIEDAGVIGIEGFPKVLSQNIFVVKNTLKRCGGGPSYVVAGGGAIKAGTMTRNAIISQNHIHNGGTAIATGMWEISEIEGNIAQDVAGFGLAITATTHRLFGNNYAAVPSFSLLKAHNNTFLTTSGFTGGSGSRSAINVNGLKTDTGPIDLGSNTMHGWDNAITIRNSLQELRNLRIHDNIGIDGSIIVTQLSANATAAVGSPTLTGAVATAGGAPLGWVVGALIESPGVLPSGTTITYIQSTAATITLSANATASGTNVTITNLSGDVDTRVTVASGNNVLTNVVNADGWAVGDIVDAPGIPAGTTVTAITLATADFTLSANALANGLATFTSGLPKALSFTRNEFSVTVHTLTGTTTNGNATVSSVSATDIAKLKVGMYVRAAGVTAGTTVATIGTTSFTLSANATASATVAMTATKARKVQIWSTGFRAVGNILRGMAAYSLDVKGGGLIEKNEFIECDPEGIADRAAIFIRDALAYTATGNTVDNNPTYGALDSIINADATTLLREAGNIGVQSTIKAVRTATSGFGGFNQNVGVSHAGRMEYWASAPPIAADGTFANGSIVWNTVRTAIRNIDHWECVAAGSPGTWRCEGTGTGTTAQRPALTVNEAGYRYDDTTTGTQVRWNGTAYV